MARTRYPYRKYEGMVAGRAWTFHWLSGIEFEELHAQSQLIFVQAREDYDPTKSPFAAWLWLYLTTRLSNFVYSLQENLPLDCVPEPQHNLNPRRQLIWKETIANLSAEAKEVVQLLLDSPAEALDIIGTEPPKKVRGALRVHLRKRGWKWNKIWDTFREIKEVLRDL